MTLTPSVSRFRQRLAAIFTQRDVLTVAFLAAACGLLFWRLITPVDADRVTLAHGDFTNAYYPYSDYQAERIWEGQLPLWNPYRNAGMPFAAEIQRAAWYPPRWLSILLAGPQGWSIRAFEWEIIAHIWLAAVFAYLFLRQLTGRAIPALVGSMIFAFGGYLTGYPMLQVSILESSIWLPLALLGAHLSGARARAAGPILAGSALAFSTLSGHIQTVVPMFYLTLAYLVFHGRREGLGWWGIAWRVALMGVVMAGLSAIQWLPTLEMLRLSPRLGLYGFTDKGSGYQFSDLFQMIWPGVFVENWSPLYAGVGGLLLAAAAVIRPRAERLFWLAALLVALLLTVGSNSAIFDIVYVLLPGFSLFRQQERAALVVVMALAVLAAYGLNEVVTLDESSRQPEDERFLRRVAQMAVGYAGVTVLAAIALVVGELIAGKDTISATASSLTFVAAISLCVMGWALAVRHAVSPWVRYAILGIVMVDLFTVAQHTTNYVPDTPENQVQAPQPKRMQSPHDVQWHVDGAVGVLSYGTWFRIPNIYGPGPLELESIDALRTIPVDKFWEVLAVRYVTLAPDITPPAQSRLSLQATYQNDQGQPYNFFEAQDPRPFAWLVYDYREASGSPDFARQIMADPRVNLREMAVTLYPPPLPLPVQHPALSQVTDFHSVTPERLEMTVSTGDNALLTLALPDYPGWRATINGQRAQIVDVYAGLVAIPVRAGENQKVVVEFVPTTQIGGGAMSALTVLGLAGYAVWAWLRKAADGRKRAD